MTSLDLQSKGDFEAGGPSGNPTLITSISVDLAWKIATRMESFTHNWEQFKRSQARQARQGRTKKKASCPDCRKELGSDLDLDAFRAHVEADVEKHQKLQDPKSIEEAFRNITLSSTKPT